MITEFIEHPLFPITVYQNTIPVIQQEFNIIKELEYERMPSNNGDYTKIKDVLTLLPNTRNKIEQHIKYYVEEVLYIERDRYKFPITKSWVNIHKHKDEAQHHFHGNAIISGVYYFKVPENSGDICFPRPHLINNFLNNIFTFNTHTVNERNTHEYRITPKEGMLLLFPSQVFHSVSINNSNEQRYSLAFNTWVSGDLGSIEIEKLKL